MDRQQSAVVGAFLIGLGIFWWLNLWWLLLPALLIAAGAVAYTQRRRAGDTVGAVQAGIWLFGLGMLFLVHAIFPGVLLLAGASLLARGHELRIDDQIQTWLAGFANRSSRPPLPSQRPPVTKVETETTGETTRL